MLADLRYRFHWILQKYKSTTLSLSVATLLPLNQVLCKNVLMQNADKICGETIDK